VRPRPFPSPTQWRANAEVMWEVNTVVRGWTGYFHYGNSAGVFARLHYWLSNRLRRWLWRKHGCRGGLHKHYTQQQLEERHGLWTLPRALPRGRLHESQRPNA